MNEPYIEEEHDGYAAWGGRGSIFVIPFVCERYHKYDLYVGSTDYTFNV